jgi:hypothetical protein
MTHDPGKDPLLEWNRLARENTENAMVSSMFEAGGKASEPVEKFSTWLLAGTAAIASFLITNSDKLIPLLSAKGFSFCGAFLCLSCVFGFVSRIFALHVSMVTETGAAVRKTFVEHLTNYQVEERKINESAKFRGITLETGVRIERLLAEFYKPLPKWVAWLATRQLNKHAGNPQIAYLPLIGSLNKQLYCAALQAVAFLGFLVAGFSYAATMAH